MPDNQKHIDHLIERFFSGEATEKERQELFLWIEESEENKNYFGDIKFINEKAVSSYPRIKVDVNLAWNKMQAKMQDYDTQQSSPRPIPLFKNTLNWLRVAAILIVVLGLSWMFITIFKGDYFSKKELITYAAVDTVSTMQLPDNSTISINRGSHIKYADDYGKKERRVILEGEAFFVVERIEDNPFVVEADETFIKVLGTSFNINTNPGDSLVEVYIKSGVVRFFTRDHEGIILEQGEFGVFNRNTGVFSKKSVYKPNIISYTNRVFMFHNTPLYEVMNMLSKVYNIDIISGSDDIKEISITVTFEDEDIDIMLEIIAETLGLKIKKNKEGFVIFSDFNL